MFHVSGAYTHIKIYARHIGGETERGKKNRWNKYAYVSCTVLHIWLLSGTVMAARADLGPGETTRR